MNISVSGSIAESASFITPPRMRTSPSGQAAKQSGRGSRRRTGGAGAVLAVLTHVREEAVALPTQFHWFCVFSLYVQQCLQLVLCTDAIRSAEKETVSGFIVSRLLRAIGYDDCRRLGLVVVRYVVETPEVVQNRAGCFIFGNYTRLSSVIAKKNTLSLPHLALRRKISRLSILSNLSHTHTKKRKHTLINPPTHISRRVDHSRKVGTLHCRTAGYSHSFIANTTSEWNHLPLSLALTHDFDELKG